MEPRCQAQVKGPRLERMPMEIYQPHLLPYLILVIHTTLCLGHALPITSSGANVENVLGRLRNRAVERRILLIGIKNTVEDVSLLL